MAEFSVHSMKAGDVIGMLPAASKRFRRQVYALLGSLITIGIVLSVVAIGFGIDVRNSATPLLREQVPQLRLLDDLETALLKQQLLLNSSFAGSIEDGEFLVKEARTRTRLAEIEEQLRTSLLHSERGPAVTRGIEQLEKLAEEFRAIDHSSMQQSADASAILGQLNDVVSSLEDAIFSTRQQLETTLYNESDRTVSSIGTISSLIAAFAALSVLTSAFMLYHARARFTFEARLAHQAGHDPLTGLPHRRALEQRLADFAGDARVLVLGVVDRFDRIVGSLGHARGDELLQALALRLAAMAASFKGEAFSLDGTTMALLLEQAAMDRCAEDAVSHVRRRMADPFVLDGHEIFVDLSLGYACDEMHDDPETLLKRASAALQTAMRMGGGSAVHYSAQIQTESLARLDMESALRHALERNELELFYQPQLALKTGRLEGFEALVRWHRTGQVVSPADFIPIAEESGLIVPIGDWILETACRQAKKWNEDRGGDDRALVVAVNISMRQFLKADFLAGVEQCLKRTGVHPSHVELELTESTTMHSPGQVLPLLQRLRALGLSLAIDDFGTGYSSLAYLQRFPIDKLKIDQSFVRDLEQPRDTSARRNAEGIVRAMCSLGHQLGLRVLAEGVEHEEQLHRLVHLGCDAIQGYHYGRPLTVDQAGAFIENERKDGGTPGVGISTPAHTLYAGFD